MAAHPSVRNIAIRLGHLKALAATMRPAGARADASNGRHPPATGTVPPPRTEGPRQRQLLHGRLAALFYAGSGVLGLVTRPLPVPGGNVAATSATGATAVVAGIAIWLAPWERWHRRAALAVVPPAFALIALWNTFGGADLRAYGVFFVVAFVWLGVAQPPRTSLAMAPLATVAYVLPLYFMPGSVDAGLASAAITIPVCVLVGEGIAWSAARLERIEQALRREQDRTERLRELAGMKDAFLSSVSHELRTPITICRGHLDVLEDGAAEREVRAVKQTLIDELDLMGRLVEDLTTLARVDDPSLLRREELPLESFVTSLAAKARPILGARLRVRSEIRGVSLRADPQRLSQALLNLIRNAREHARGNGPVWLRVQAEPTGCRFEVADEGGGLPPGDEQAVFEPFSTGSSRGGTGLGLSIVRGIAMAHSGQAGVANHPGQGATFWIRIPW